MARILPFATTWLALIATATQGQPPPPPSFAELVLVPAITFNLNVVMQRPFETLRFTKQTIKQGYLVVDGEDDSLRSWTRRRSRARARAIGRARMAEDRV